MESVDRALHIIISLVPDFMLPLDDHLSSVDMPGSLLVVTLFSFVSLRSSSSGPLSCSTHRQQSFLILSKSESGIGEEAQKTPPRQYCAAPIRVRKHDR